MLLRGPGMTRERIGQFLPSSAWVPLFVSPSTDQLWRQRGILHSFLVALFALEVWFVQLRTIEVWLFMSTLTICIHLLMPMWARSAALAIAISGRLWYSPWLQTVRSQSRYAQVARWKDALNHCMNSTVESTVEKACVWTSWTPVPQICQWFVQHILQNPAPSRNLPNVFL
jgi:hypothetical protein